MKLLVLTLLVAASAPAQTPPPSVSPCTAGQLTLTFDQKEGAFGGMQKSGVLVVFRNHSANACTLPLHPAFTFADKQHRPVTFIRKVPVGMHPGPVEVPVVVPPRARVTAPMAWIEGPVFDKNTCLDIASISLKLGLNDLSKPFRARVCTETGKAGAYTLDSLRPDRTKP